MENRTKTRIADQLNAQLNSDIFDSVIFRLKYSRFIKNRPKLVQKIVQETIK